MLIENRPKIPFIGNPRALYVVPQSYLCIIFIATGPTTFLRRNGLADMSSKKRREFVDYHRVCTNNIGIFNKAPSDWFKEFGWQYVKGRKIRLLSDFYYFFQTSELKPALNSQ